MLPLIRKKNNLHIQYRFFWTAENSTADFLSRSFQENGPGGYKSRKIPKHYWRRWLATISSLYATGRNASERSRSESISKQSRNLQVPSAAVSSSQAQYYRRPFNCAHSLLWYYRSTCANFTQSEKIPRWQVQSRKFQGRPPVSAPSYPSRTLSINTTSFRFHSAFVIIT